MTEAKTTRNSSLRKTGERLVPSDIPRASAYIQYLQHPIPVGYIVKEIRTPSGINQTLGEFHERYSPADFRGERLTVDESLSLIGECDNKLS
jgi:hypothetical protein